MTPYDFFPAVLLASLLAAGWYGFGLMRCTRSGSVPPTRRTLAYLAGVLMIYTALQTRFDYWSQHMFCVHRLHQFVLHYLAPVLIMAAAPGRVLAAALPERLRKRADRLAAAPPVRSVLRMLFDPVIAVVLFSGLMVLWAIPPVHFYTMLSVRLYSVMNWSVALSGLLFWGLILDPRSPKQTAALGYGTRLGALLAVIATGGALSAAIGLSDDNLYPIYAVCGRLWPLNPMTDQRLGGMVGVLGAAACITGLLTVAYRMVDEQSERAAAQRGAENAPGSDRRAHQPVPPLELHRGPNGGS